MTAKSDLALIAKAALRTAESIWGAYAFLMAGFLAGAVERHPDLERAISGEAGYTLFMRWEGDADYVVPVLLLIVFLFGLSIFQRVAQKAGWCEPGDGMSWGRNFIRNFLIPTLIGTASFAIGILGGKTWATLGAAAVSLFCVFTVATTWHYWNDLAE